MLVASMLRLVDVRFNAFKSAIVTDSSLEVVVRREVSETYKDTAWLKICIYEVRVSFLLYLCSLPVRNKGLMFTMSQYALVPVLSDARRGPTNLTE